MIKIKKMLKKIPLIVFIFFIVLFLGCGVATDTSSLEGVINIISPDNLILNEVIFTASNTILIELFNQNNTNFDLSQWRLLYDNMNAPLTNFIYNEENENISAEGIITSNSFALFVVPNSATLNRFNGSIELFVNNMTDNPNSINSYIQWGMVNTLRQNIAVQENLWTMDHIISIDYSFGYDGSGFTTNDWVIGIPTPSQFAQSEDEGSASLIPDVVYITEVGRTSSNVLIELFNPSNESVNLENWFFYVFTDETTGVKTAISNLKRYTLNEDNQLEVISTDSHIIESSNVALFVYTNTIDFVVGSIGLFTNDDFSSEDSLQSFLQWGRANTQIESLAVSKLIWSNDAFISSDIALSYDNTPFDVNSITNEDNDVTEVRDTHIGSDDWELTTPTVNDDN